VRVVVPYATLYPETKAALEADGQTPEYVSVAGDPTAYYQLLARLWEEGRGFTIVEQDIVPRPGCIAELEACPEPWCGFVYPISTGFITGLGLTRFSDDLVRDHPAVVTTIDTLPRTDPSDRRYWGRLDTRLAQVLMDHERLTVHRHTPPVRHLNPVQPLPHYNCVRCGAAVPEEVMLAGEPPYPCRRCGRPAMGPD